MNCRRLRFLFIQPDFHRHYVSFFPVYEPLHGMLFAALVKDLADSRIFDRRFDTDESLVLTLKSFTPDIVAFTTHTAGELFCVLRLAQLVKQACPKAVTIVGGQHATLLPEDFQDPALDLICIGPGEETIREVVEAMYLSEPFTDIPGLAVRTDTNSWIFTEPRRICSGSFSWPPFDRTLLDKRYLRHYLQHFERRRAVYTITTSGCPHRCKFCALWAAARSTYRRREPEEVVLDIVSQPQPFVHLTDDNTFDNEAHAREICRLLKKHKVKKKILAYARTDTIVRKPDLLKGWRDAGLGALVVGMEAVNDKHLGELNKRASVDTNIEAHLVLESLGIENWAHFVLMPDFEKEDFEEIWDFIDHYQLTYPILVPMTPVPGTPLFFEAKAAGDISCFDYGYYNLQYMVLQTKIPKREWYDHLHGLYRKTCSFKTLMKRRKSPSFDWRPAFFRALVVRVAMSKIGAHVDEQLRHEEAVCYQDIEHTLPPSLRSDYLPVNYYNSTKQRDFSESHPAPPP